MLFSVILIVREIKKKSEVFCMEFILLVFGKVVIGVWENNLYFEFDLIEKVDYYNL